MTRILSYNILYGGAGRVNELTKMIGSVQPDVVGLVEARNPHVVEELAHRLGMQHCSTTHGNCLRKYEAAVLSRLPIVHTEIYLCPGILTKPLLEVCVEEVSGQHLTLFVTHLSAAFNRLWAGDYIRRREVRELLRIMATRQGTPHLLMGDFNTLSPGDAFRGSQLLRYILYIEPQLMLEPEWKQGYIAVKGHPSLNFVVPPYLRILKPLLRAVPRSKLFCELFDAAAALYVPRGSVKLLRDVGYVDCFRRVNPQACGFTCPASAPAGRIDYIFASPQLARRLTTCGVVTEAEDISGEQASDHFPVFAEFDTEQNGL